MANPGAGNKFVSVNLNKSYGQHQQHHYSNSYSSGRTRPNNLGGGGSGNGGGMVVLSRPRSSQKSGPKLSVPPPLNLPSLRKEHEKFDSLGTGNGSAGAGVSGSGLRPSSSGMGWTKPVAAAVPEKDGLAFGRKGISDIVDQDTHHSHDGLSKGGSAYQAPAKSGIAGVPAEKSTVLRGEDFPSLRATLLAASGPTQKLKDGLNQKQKQVAGELMSGDQKDTSHLSSHVDMRPQLLSSRHTFANGLHENGNQTNSFGSSQMAEPIRKQDDYFLGPLPLVRLSPRSDWADDERDTGHGLIDRGRDYGLPKVEAHWDGDFDIPKASFFPHKPGHTTFDRWGLRDSETGKITSSEVPKADSHGRDLRIPSREGREGNSWRTASNLPKDGSTAQEIRNDRNGLGARPSSSSMETKKDSSKYLMSPSRDSVQNDFGRNNQGGKLPWNSSRDLYGNDHGYQNNLPSKPSTGSKGLSLNDSLTKFPKEKRVVSKSDKPYPEDSFFKELGDGWDTFPGSLLGIVKRKKDGLKQADFHDPVRESFEAELERVQKMQELERQKIIEEQERALELVRREEEERARLAREDEERRRRLEEEAREVAWREEQERLEAFRQAEEQRIAREEEKRRILMEEERRKQAAKQKLLELEEKIAKRQSEVSRDGSNVSVADEKGSSLMKQKEFPRVTDGGDWEDNEKMGDRIAISASSDSSGMTRPFDMASGSNFSREDSSILVERGKNSNNWRRESSFESGSNSTFVLPEHESGQYGSRRESSFGGKVLSRKEFYGGAGYLPSRTYNKGASSEPQMDGFSHMRGQRWNLIDGDHYQRSTDVDSGFSENPPDRYNDVGWGQGRPHSNPYSLYPEQYCQHSDSDGPYSFGRSRYAMRQPRVLPPPSLTSMHKSSRKGEDEHLGSSSFVSAEIQYGTATSEPARQTNYDSGVQENMEGELVDRQHEKVEHKRDQGTARRCDSQSSLSVSSAPDSPIHLSHDDLDESGDYPVRSAALEDGDFLRTGNGADVLPSKVGEANIMTIPSSVSSGGDDAEWASENNAELQEQEEYDEYEEGFREEDEVREVEDDSSLLAQELEGMHLENNTAAGMMNILGLGFSENVEVQIINDELEISKRKEVATIPVQSIAVVNPEQKEFFDRDGNVDQTHHHADCSSRRIADHASEIMEESGKGMQIAAIKTNNALVGSATSDTLNNMDVTVYHAPPVPQAVPSATILAPQSAGHTVMSSASAAATQAEVPFKLQFGLFSGPSLIPTPVPAIQIGSIQMPLHLHPQVSPSVGPVQPSQPPLFQFGQLRYTSPVSPGVVPLAPQSMSFVHSAVPTNFSLNQSTSGPFMIQSGQEASAENLEKLSTQSISSGAQTSLLLRPLDPPQGNSLPVREKAEHPLMMQQSQVEHSGKNNRISGLHSEEQLQNSEVATNYKSFSNSKDWEGQAQPGPAPSQMVKQEKDFTGSKVHGSVTSSRGKHYVFKVKNVVSKSPYPDYEASVTDGSGYQRRPRQTIRRTEFRVRDSGVKRQTAASGSANQLVLDDKSYVNARNPTISARSGSMKGALSEVLESDSMISGATSVQEMDTGSGPKMSSRKESFVKGQAVQQVCSVEGSHKRDAAREDVDAPLQSGIVRVFEQPGIEAPSDEDDFIEVRSKRQMLNDKREQREKEIKAKSRVTKVSRRARSSSSATGSASLKTIATRGESTRSNIHSDFNANEGRDPTDFEVSSGFNTGMVAQPLAPIGTPAPKSEAQADLRSFKTRSVAFASPSDQSLRPGLTFKDKNKVVDDVQTALDSWEGSGINQQVMALTQSQLDEAMKPAKFESRVSIGDHSIADSEHIIPSSSILTKDKPFSSSASPINSLLAGEKIQFGAVTSPTVLAPSSHSVSHGISPPGPCQPDIKISHKFSGTENECTLFFEKEKNADESRVHLEDCEAEAEAAASAVAIAAAAISSDEIVSHTMGTCSASVTESKTFGTVDVNGIPVGVPGDQHPSSQSRVEEPLSVSLPADLSVETSPISLWPPLTTSQSTSNQMLSHFPGGLPSHFPFYDMNTMMGSPIFAFGPNEESASSQSQKSSSPGPGQHATWQQCHSGVDSFYGTPAGFTGPFISPGGLPGVQGPPHMVVYNHFAPVGQFGQVGLSFMGTTFIPSGKQPDWKHNPTSSAMAGEGDVNMNVVSAQRGPINMPSPIHHVAPGSPLLPMASPLAMFDVSPFQSSGEMPVHARWSPLPSSALQSISMPMPVLQQAEAVLPSHYNSNNTNAQPSVDPSLTAKRFAESQSSTPAESRNFPVAADATANQLPDELGLVERPSSSTMTKSTSLEAASDVGKTDNVSQNASSAAFSTQTSQSQPKNPQQHQHYSTTSGYNSYQRGTSQKNNSSSSSGASEWPHRRGQGFQGRNHSFGVEKSFPSSKVKQIYVAKHSSSRNQAMS